MPSCAPAGPHQPRGCLCLTCLKVLYGLAVVVSKSIPSPPFTATPGVSKLVGRQSKWERQKAQREGHGKTLFEALSSWHMWTCGRGLQSCWSCRRCASRCQRGGAREFGWRQSHRLSVMSAVSPAHPWHVCGMEDAQWVGQLACIPGHLALSPALLPTAFPQLDCSG